MGLLLIYGCTFFPRSGPSGVDVTSPPSSDAPYALLKLTPDLVDQIARAEPQSLAGTFHDSKPPAQIKFGIGDVVSVTVFEAAAGGLYMPKEAGIRPGNFVTFPDQIVDNDGNISVPYAGEIKAAGRTNVEIQNEILSKIRQRAIDPQVIVSATQQRSSLVSVMGEVNLPVRYAAFLAGAQDRITDALTRAQGIKGQGFETWIILERGNRRAIIPFENLVMIPSNNIYIQPGDRIFVYREQQKFIALGATGQQNEFNFDAWRISLAEAVAKAGGLLDIQSDPGSVFLYRREPKEVAAQLGIDVGRFRGDTVPVIFAVSFQDPGGYFLATKLEMRNQDVLFAANAPAVEVAKFLQFLNLSVGSASTVALGIQYGVGAKSAISTATAVTASPSVNTP